jgi:hypothetical protein
MGCDTWGVGLDTAEKRARERAFRLNTIARFEPTARIENLIFDLNSYAAAGKGSSEMCGSESGIWYFLGRHDAFTGAAALLEELL